MILDQIRAEQLQMPKAERFRLNDLLSKLELKRATYYDERKRISNKFDKYHEVKRQMMIIAQKYSMRNRFTAGYRRIQVELERLGIHLAGDTIRSLMRDLDIQVTIYNRHQNRKYSSYRGTVGHLAPNRLHQNFGATKPYQVCHTDVSQVRLANQTWAYLSVMTDEASKEVLACQVSLHPNSDLITSTVDELIRNLPDHACPLIHSDQGWQYQLPFYTQRLANHHFVQSMSRKGHCLDNAPVESFFHILKTELLDGLPLFEDITAFKMMVQDYIHFFNYERVSLKTKGMTPVEYRNHAMTA